MNAGGDDKLINNLCGLTAKCPNSCGVFQLPCLCCGKCIAQGSQKTCSLCLDTSCSQNSGSIKNGNT